MYPDEKDPILAKPLVNPIPMFLKIFKKRKDSN